MNVNYTVSAVSWGRAVHNCKNIRQRVETRSRTHSVLRQRSSQLQNARLRECLIK